MEVQILVMIQSLIVDKVLWNYRHFNIICAMGMQIHPNGVIINYHSKMPLNDFHSFN